MHHLDRRTFIKSSTMAAVALAINTSESFGSPFATTNKLPYWRGFNLLDFFSPDPASQRPSTKEEYFKWMRDWGFDFVRIPIAYPCYLDIDRSRNITPEDVYKISNQGVEKIDALVSLAHKYGFHVSLNLHRAPGYCVNAGFNEPYNLWADAAAQDAFYFHWNMWAKKYKNTSAAQVSFDLLNEPCMRKDMNDQHSERSAVPGDLYRKVALAAMQAIRKENKGHLIIADGNNVGSDVIHEITDLDIAQSCRGYFPGIISHYKAPWAMKDTDNLPTLKYPGQVGNEYLSRAMLEEYYKPWGELVKKGVGVHCGECGCYNKTPHDIFLAWFTDVIDVLKQHRIGFSLWEFSGDFGVLNSNRPDVNYEDWHGQKLDRKLLNLLVKK
jgi:endoglucanase